MSWHISNALMRAYASSPCSQAQEAASLAGTCSDGDASAPSNGSLTPLLYLPPDRTKAFSRLSRSGMTFGILTEPLGAALLTWYREGFRAKTSAAPERGRASKGSGPACGKKWRGSLAKYDPGTRSWRTAQFSLLGGLELFSETWPRWGTMRNGECSEQTTPVLHIKGNGSGYWQTPVADDAVNRVKGKWNSRGEPKLSAQVLTIKSPVSDKMFDVEFVVVKDGANTPSGNWPTPTCADAFTDKLKSSQQQEGSMHSVNLSQAVKMWPTPTSRDFKGPVKVGKRITSSGKEQNYGEQLPNAVGGGQLNPDWVEWLMGWPLGWTDLRPLETDRFPPPHRWHGIPCTNELKRA